ncbi:hypothetical protein COW36_17200 [bacterium (Candidatus Blackallbacteria) CG17_big_fil_post_rev_8_21_14_2_50_48_46]|uniref:ATP synthase subunit I n=1 Tax=bacterium (Candidatus Blackallbacteria) CG17_big_fil_post_rev_8_21_14_2_50_48_46 TaxID=2014261 RepID=A0A2M7G187_9BACT|nr:MAG: hypothetical protein COW64_01530 [bacterium (Candidatus Blackallbacteria) CG18_big_fil_WC_8_21_14_2_50_49_26]PIW15449.1 MAG: hypothetical protein COW36_17200 [bacterium (Candidatus Blackallbacteria) CG17_big_fil_post_rev_8_21_14_2_50_48_46]PIW50162.1 MAG: hypothetical protein COW20_03570 [bacterium (Candidatus Blackallbacteria) CG13_big_fil_rev_8_21_14_2_50_49_14]
MFELWLLTAFLTGILLSLIFFGGLWWTVQKGLKTQQPARLFLSSSLLRTGLVLLGFYTIANHHWERFLACLLGFVLGRQLVLKFSKATDKSKHCAEVQHAPES